MITQPPAFSVLSTPVALCDRRALSEAWYSALHVHKDGAPANATPRAMRVAAAMQPGRVQMPCKVRTGQSSKALPVLARLGTASALAGAPANERRIAPSKLAQKIERAFIKPKHPPKHASFSLEGASGRVQILLQQSGSRTQIVALCPPGARDVVARALREARYALALRGLSIQADVRGFAR